MDGLLRLLSGVTKKGDVALAAADAMAGDRVWPTGYQECTNLIKNLAQDLSPAKRKELAFRLVRMGRLIPERPWEGEPDGYVPEGKILVRDPSGASRRVEMVHDERVARLWMNQIYADALGPVVADALREAEWSLGELEALLDDSGGPFVAHSRCEHGFVRSTPYDVRRWPWGAAPFIERLGEYEGEPGFEHLLERFLTEVLAWAYPAEEHAVPVALESAARSPEVLGRLFEKLDVIEGERLAFIEELDLRRVESALRFMLSFSILGMLERRYHPVEDTDGSYKRVLRAIGFRGLEDFLTEQDRKRREGLEAIHSSRGVGSSNLLTGEDHFVDTDGQITWVEPDEYLAEIRSLADHPPERPGIPRISSEDFLGHFSPEQLKRQYSEVEDPHPSGLSRKWRYVWETTGRDPGATAALLGVFYEYPSQSTISAVPPEAWWERWRETVVLVGPEVARGVCEGLLDAGKGERTSSAGLFGNHWAMERIHVASTYAMATVAGPGTCGRLAAIARDPKRYPEPICICAARALELIGSPEALSGLAQAKVRLKNKNVLRPVEDCLGRLAAQRGVDVETLEDLVAEDFGLGADGSRVWRLGDYLGELRLSEDGKVAKSFRSTKTGKTARSVPQAAKEAAPGAPQEITAAAKSLRSGYATQKERVERAMVAGREWGIGDWRRVFVGNPLLNNLARRLVWRLGDVYAVADGSGGFLGAEGIPVEAGERLSLAHPVEMVEAELAAWRRWLVAGRVVQPFKQVFRETYVLTSAEEETSTYSNRFAAHVVNHRRIYALLKERGWSGMYMLGEHEEPARKDYPRQMLRALFDHSGEMDIGNVGGSDSFVTDRVWFARLHHRRRRLEGGDTVPLSEVPPVPFSEAMRDVDLFVAAAGVGMDPDWESWESRRARDAAVWAERRALYEKQQSATADQRAALLRELLPALGLAESVRLDGKFALVHGERADYRVHLGSGNVHREPDGRYICIVPERGRSAGLYVPFEESDEGTAEILSKLLLLSEDECIEDPMILEQIRS